MLEYYKRVDSCTIVESEDRVTVLSVMVMRMMMMMMGREISHVTFAVTQSAEHPSKRTNEIQQASVIFCVWRFPADQSFNSMVQK